MSICSWPVRKGAVPQRFGALEGCGASRGATLAGVEPSAHVNNRLNFRRDYPQILTGGSQKLYSYVKLGGGTCNYSGSRP